MISIIVGLIGIIGGLTFAAWLGGYVMLYQGIRGAIACPNPGSIIKIIFCEAGMFPGFMLVGFTAIWLEDQIEWLRWDRG